MSDEVANLSVDAVAPEVEVIQVLFIAKHPAVRLKPTFDVDVAEPEIVSPESVVVPKPVVETVRNGVAPTRNAPEINELVVVALVEVEFVKTPVFGVVLPIGVFSMVPALMVRLSATCASVAEPMSEVKLIPRDEVASC